MDKYRKVKVVGKGSFGFAVLVQSVIDRKLYIMKIIDVSRMDRKQKEEALNEVHVLKAMRHPYIVTYRESFMDKRCLCIVMDYADGGDMYTKIAKQKKIGKGFPEDLLLDWFVQICLAIKHIHDRKILHRDLKTQNVFLTSKGEIKIGDFGIARVLQHTYDCAQTAIGTPYYLSPEICQEKPYNQKSDVWSLGCILYEMVTLRHAFDANSMKGLVVKILKGTYPAIPNCYSQNLKDLIADMLQKDPKNRPSAKRVLERDFLSSRISNLLSQTVAKHEFGKTYINQLNPNLQASSEENKDSDTSSRQDRQERRARFEDARREAAEPTPPTASSRSRRDQRPPSAEEIITKVRESHDERRDRNIKKSPSARVNNYVEEQNYSEVIQSLQECLERRNATEDEYFEEEENQRVRANFLTPEGVPLPGVEDADSAFARIEALRCYLENQIGLDEFIQAYSYLQDPPEQDDTSYLQGILGSGKMRYVPLIYQMIVCEDAYYTTGNQG